MGHHHRDHDGHGRLRCPRCLLGGCGYRPTSECILCAAVSRHRAEDRVGTLAPSPKQYVEAEAGNACWVPNSTVVLSIVETFNGLGPTTNKNLAPVDRAVNSAGNWAPYPLPPPDEACYRAFPATLHITAENADRAGNLFGRSNTITVPACSQG